MKWEHPHDTRWIFRIAGYLAALGLVVWLAVLVFPHQIPDQKSPNIWNTTLDNRWFLEAVRVVVIVGGLYIIVSVGALVHYGRWLTKFGPLATGKQIQDVRGRIKELEGEVTRVNAENGRLTSLVARHVATLSRIRPAVVEGGK